METLIEAAPFSVISLVTDGTFSVWLTKDLEKSKLHGPSASTVRRNRIVIPEGYDGIVVCHAKDVHIEVESISVHNPKELRSGERKVTELVDPTGDDPVKQMHAVMVASLAEIERRYADKAAGVPSEEDADDFDVDDPDVAPWEIEATGYEVMEDDVPDEVISWAEYIASRQTASPEAPENGAEGPSEAPEATIAPEPDPTPSSASSGS